MMKKSLGGGLLALFLLSGVALPEKLFASSSEVAKSEKKGMGRKISSWVRRKKAGAKSSTEQKEAEEKLERSRKRSGDYFARESKRAGERHRAMAERARRYS